MRERAKRASEASSVEQVNDRAVRENEQMNDRVAQQASTLVPILGYSEPLWYGKKGAPE